MKSQIPMNRKLRSLIIGITNYMKSQTLMNRKLRSLIIGITNAGRSQTPIFFFKLDPRGITDPTQGQRPNTDTFLGTKFENSKKKILRKIFFSTKFC